MVGAGRCCFAITRAAGFSSSEPRCLSLSSRTTGGRQAPCDRDDNNAVFCTAQTTTDDSALASLLPKSPKKGPNIPSTRRLLKGGRQDKTTCLLRRVRRRNVCLCAESGHPAYVWDGAT